MRWRSGHAVVHCGTVDPRPRALAALSAQGITAIACDPPSECVFVLVPKPSNIVELLTDEGNKREWVRVVLAVRDAGLRVVGRVREPWTPLRMVGAVLAAPLTCGAVVQLPGLMLLAEPEPRW